jgi:predicted outer membrane lipoprotein
MAYHLTKSFTATTLVALLFSAAFIQLYPPILWTLGLPLMVAFCIAEAFFFLYKERRPKTHSAYTEDFGE